MTQKHQARRAGQQVADGPGWVGRRLRMARGDRGRPAEGERGPQDQEREPLTGQERLGHRLVRSGEDRTGLPWMSP